VGVQLQQEKHKLKVNGKQMTFLANLSLIISPDHSTTATGTSPVKAMCVQVISRALTHRTHDEIQCFLESLGLFLLPSLRNRFIRSSPLHKKLILAESH